MAAAQTSKKNIPRAAEALGMNDHNSLAGRPGWKLDDKRWLRRIWELGLDRADPRRADCAEQNAFRQHAEGRTW